MVELKINREETPVLFLAKEKKNQQREESLYPKEEDAENYMEMQ